jgi:hypothetical protein
MLARFYVLVFFVTAIFLLTYAAAQDKVAPSQPAKQASVEQLIDRLGSGDFETRDAARRALLERPDALPALRRALHSDDAEIRRAVAMILEEFQARDRKLQVKRALDFLDKSEVDTFVDLVTSLELPLEDEIWQAMCAYVKKVADAAGRRNLLPAIREITENKASRDCSLDKGVKQYQSFSEWRLVAQELTKREMFKKCLVVCKGDVEAEISLEHTILFTNGDFIRKSNVLWNSVVIADSTRSIDGHLSCFVITRGKGGMVVLNSRVDVEREPKVRALVKFFDPTQVGIEAAEGKGGVRVTKVHGGKPFAVAGVKEDDVVTAIDGTAADSPESFRRLLRAKRAKGGDFVLKLRRGDQTKDFTIHLQD